MGVSNVIDDYRPASVEEEIKILAEFIKKLGDESTNSITFGKLVESDEVADALEALVGTLKAAKKRGIVKYDAELLLKGVSDNVIITLAK